MQERRGVVGERRSKVAPNCDLLPRSWKKTKLDLSGGIVQIIGRLVSMTQMS